jgi:hypothetical protein
VPVATPLPTKVIDVLGQTEPEGVLESVRVGNKVRCEMEIVVDPVQPLLEEETA